MNVQIAKDAYSKVKKEVSNKYNWTNNKHYYIIHDILFLSSFRLCLITIAKARIVTGQRPTYKPSSSLPENHKNIEYKKFKNAKITG